MIALKIIAWIVVIMCIL